MKKSSIEAREIPAEVISKAAGSLSREARVEANQRGNEVEQMARDVAEAEAWLQEQILRSQDKVVVLVVKVTPALATALLKINSENRNMSRAAVKQHVTNMLEGRWQLNGQTIVVSIEGLLNDGQHRCEGIVQSGVTVEIIMVFGVTRDSRFTLDQGKVRSVADFLHMHGVTNADILGTVANFVLQYRQRNRLTTGGNLVLTNAQKLDTVLTEEELQNSFAFINRGRRLTQVGGKTLLVFLHWLFADLANADLADDFFRQVMDLTDENAVAKLEAGSPFLYIKTRISKDKLNAAEKAQLYFRCWNAWAQGQKLDRVVLNGKDELPELFVPESFPDTLPLAA